MSLIYDINYRKLTRWLVPHALRKARMMSWLDALVSQVVANYRLFTRYRDAKLYQLAITPQVCFLEKMLNDRFDATERRIFIEDGIRYDVTYLFMEAEEKPLFLKMESEADPVFIYTNGETELLGNDFVVYVPAGLGFNNDEMRALLNAYKLASKRYAIQII